MKLNIPDNYGQLPVDGQEPYLPYISVRDDLLADPTLPIGEVSEAVRTLRRGFMPEKGAVVNLGGGLLGAFDLVAVECVSGKEAVIVPAAKSAVDDQTDELAGLGVVTLTDDRGRLKIVSVVDRYYGFGRKIELNSTGGVVLRELGIDAPCYEVVEEDSGLIRAVARF